MAKEPHVPVLVKEYLEFFKDVKLKVFFDGTLGAAGHAEALLKAHPEIEVFIGCDRDEHALKLAKERLEPWKKKVKLFHGNFSDLDLCLKQLKIKKVDGFFFDLGVSSMQLDEDKRGFSFSKEGPLDMRMDPTQDLTAKKIVNSWPEKKLGELFKEFGEEPRWKQAAQAIVQARRKKTIETTTQLADIVTESLKVRTKKRLHPATLIFQALRMCVNRELESVQEGIQKALQFLAPGGKIGAISFHSLEDRIVKNLLRDASKPLDKFKRESDKHYLPMLKVLTKKPVTATTSEVRKNPRSRSAKMRFAEKLVHF